MIAVIFSISAVCASEDASLNETGDILASQDVNEDETTFLKEVLKTTLVVKQPLSAVSTVSIKNIDSKRVLSAVLKTDGVAQANKKITFKFNGKTYTAKTDKNGIAKVTIKKNVIKKLKADKKYPVKISYFNNVVKTKVKVKK